MRPGGGAVLVGKRGEGEERFVSRARTVKGMQMRNHCDFSPLYKSPWLLGRSRCLAWRWAPTNFVAFGGCTDEALSYMQNPLESMHGNSGEIAIEAVKQNGQAGSDTSQTS